MAATNLNFAAQVDAWVKQTEARMTAVFRGSAQRTISLAQSYVPVDTGYLRASLQVSLESMPQLEKNTGAIKAALSAAGQAFAGGGASRARGSGYFQSTGAYVRTIAGAQIGQTIYAGYTANYAGHVEYGTSRQAPQAYVGRAAMQWQTTVNRVVSELKSRSGV